MRNETEEKLRRNTLVSAGASAPLFAALLAFLFVWSPRQRVNELEARVCQGEISGPRAAAKASDIIADNPMAFAGHGDSLSLDGCAW
jgi:hypothetical protein